MSEAPRVIGLEPWLPWPLRSFGWWSRPVRVERLAALRIAMAGCSLVDILTSYRPYLNAFFGTEGLGGSRLFAFYGEAPRLNWSLLRGPGDPLLGMLALATWITLSVWLLLGFCRARQAVASSLSSFLQRERWTVGFWLLAGSVVLIGAWSRHTLQISNAPAVLRSWQDDPCLLASLFWSWVVATAMLFIGLWTRLAVVLTWALTLSFANANPHIDNAGDAIRAITLFTLMLSPCGAVWSVDSWWNRRRQSRAERFSGVGPILIWPWALRLLFVQLCVIYFMNGLYKLTGANWTSGDSVYYVLCDVTLTRFSIAQLPISFAVLRLATWLVLAWELSFPFLMLFQRTRAPALTCGVLFHLGIFASMELGGFVPYILCLYVPLLPWDRWLGGETSYNGIDSRHPS